MKIFCSCLIFIISIGLSAQVYLDRSDILPVPAAQSQAMDVKAADIDSDGDLDIVLANEFQSNTLLINEGPLGFKKQTIALWNLKAADSEDVIITDLDGDGIVDIAFCSEDDIKLGRTQVHEIYKGQGNLQFTQFNYQLPDSEANALISEDVTGDQMPDMFLGNRGKNGFYVNDGNGGFLDASAKLSNTTKTTQDLHLFDADGDGDLDLMEGNENGSELLIFNDLGEFVAQTQDRFTKY